MLRHVMGQLAFVAYMRVRGKDAAPPCIVCHFYAGKHFLLR